MDEEIAPFVNGEVRCPSCHRKRPMSDLLVAYDPANDLSTVKGIHCSHCQYQSVTSRVGLIQWGSQIPEGWRTITAVKNKACPYCSRVMVKVPGGPRPAEARTFTYLKCPESPLVYRLEV